MQDIERHLRRIDPAQLLPLRSLRGEGMVPARVSLVDSLELAPGRWLALVDTETDGMIVAALAEDGETLRRASAGDGVAEALLARVLEGGSTESFVFRPYEGADAYAGLRGERMIDVDQSNDSLVVGERAVVKRYTRTSANNQRPLLMGGHLSATGFEEIPRHIGSVAWMGVGELPVPVANCTAYLPGSVDGWEWFVCLVDGNPAEALQRAAEVGGIAARLHAALSRPSDVFPNPIDAADGPTIRTWERGALSNLTEALGVTRGSPSERLAARAGEVRKELAAFSPIGFTPTIPIHGDLHVGQYLLWDGGLAVIDFDGNPLEAGGVSGAAAMDLASLVQSIDHAGRVVQRRRDDDGSEIDEWIDQAVDSCMRSYLVELEKAGVGRIYDERLLRPFRVAQELHEYVYAARYLPSWVDVADRALAALLS